MATFGLVHGAWHGGWCWEHSPFLGRPAELAALLDDLARNAC